MSTGTGSDSIRTILVATDFSETASLALARAVELARLHSARIVLVHGFELTPLLIAGPGLMALPPDYEFQVREASAKTLEQWAADATAEGVEIAAELRMGPGAACVIEAADRHNADLVVTGSRGLSGFAHLLLGRTAMHIVRESPCPVLTVHPSDTGELGDIRKVLVPTDFSEDAQHATSLLGRLFVGRESQTELTLVHAYQVPVALTPLGSYYPVMSVLPSDARKLAHEALEPMAERLRRQGFSVEIIGVEGDPATVITELAGSTGADLIAMGTRGLTGLKHVLLGSVAERVVRHAPCPVLTVGRGKAAG